MAEALYVRIEEDKTVSRLLEISIDGRMNALDSKRDDDLSHLQYHQEQASASME